MASMRSPWVLFRPYLETSGVSLQHGALWNWPLLNILGFHSIYTKCTMYHVHLHGICHVFISDMWKYFMLKKSNKWLPVIKMVYRAWYFRKKSIYYSNMHVLLEGGIRQVYARYISDIYQKEADSSQELTGTHFLFLFWLSTKLAWQPLTSLRFYQFWLQIAGPR